MTNVEKLMPRKTSDDLETADQFSLDEAFRLMDSVVIRKSNNEQHPSLDFGVVSGVLAVNDEIELVIKFLNGLSQFNKSEFTNQFRIYEEDNPF